MDLIDLLSQQVRFSVMKTRNILKYNKDKVRRKTLDILKNSIGLFDLTFENDCFDECHAA